MVEDYTKKPQIGPRLVFDPGPSESVIVTTDPDALGIALQNLIDNAMSHGAPGAPIEVVIGLGPTVRVVNEGPIIGPDELKKLKGRFERAGRRSAPGSGLGLAIVDEIMRQAGGSLELSSPACGRMSGFEATLRFPAKLPLTVSSTNSGKAAISRRDGRT